MRLKIYFRSNDTEFLNWDKWSATVGYYDTKRLHRSCTRMKQSGMFKTTYHWEHVAWILSQVFKASWKFVSFFHTLSCIYSSIIETWWKDFHLRRIKFTLSSAISTRSQFEPPEAFSAIYWNMQTFHRN